MLMNHPLGAILLLRFRLMLNQSSPGSVLALVVAGMLGLLGLALAMGLGVVCHVVFAVRRGGPPEVTLLMLDAIAAGLVFLWAMELSFEAQQSSFLDFRKMFHFPVSMRGVFFLNYMASLCSPTLMLYGAAVAGTLAGLRTRHEFSLPAAAVLAVLFYGMGAAWVYWMRGVLARLMSHARWKTWAGMLAMLLLLPVLQLPVFMAYLGSEGRMLELLESGHSETILRLHQCLPPAWFSYGLWCLLQGASGEALWYAGAMLPLTGLPLWLGYRGQLRYYLGRSSGISHAARPGAQSLVDAGRTWTLCQIPRLEEETAGLAAAYWLTLFRNPNLRMATLMTFMLAGVVVCLSARGLSQLLPSLSVIPEDRLALAPETMLFMVLPLLFLGFWPCQFNLFGIDAEGFRRLMLLPVARHRVFLGANLALCGMQLGLCALLSALVALSGGWSAGRLMLFTCSALWLCLACTIAGNVWSCYFPFRMEAARMQARRNSLRTLLSTLFVQMLIGGLFVPVALALGLDTWVPLNLAGHSVSAGLLFMLVLLLASAGGYWLALPGLGDLLLSREQRILEALAHRHE